MGAGDDLPPWTPPEADGGHRPRRHVYEKVLGALEGRWKRRTPDRGRMMLEIVAGLWDALGGKDVSWCGFYLPAADGQLTLGPHRDKPACSPIGAHGVCGKALSTRETQVVADVTKLGDAHIACDPADRSEIAVPVIDAGGHVFAVLDVDSRATGAFNDEDRRWLERIVKSLGEASPPS